MRIPHPRAGVRLRLAAALVALGAVARAEPAGDAVDLSIAGSERDTAAIAGAVREPLERLGLRVTAGTRAACARVRIDASSARRVEIDVFLDSSDVPPMHRTVTRDASHPIFIDQVAYVVRTTVESMLALRSGRTDSPEAPPGSSTEPAAPVPPARNDTPLERPSLRRADSSRSTALRLTLAPFATERAMSTAVNVPGLGLALGLTLSDDRPFRPSLWLSGSLYTAFDASTGNAAVLGVRTRSVRLVPSLGILRLGPLWLDAGLGGGADFFDAELATLSENRTDGTFAVRLAHPGGFVDPVLTAQLLLGVRAIPNVSITLGAAADYALAPHRYSVAAGPGAEEILYEPWHLRPALLAGLHMTIDPGNTPLAAKRATSNGTPSEDAVNGH